MQAGLQAAQRREMGLLGLLAGLAALAIPRLALGRLGGALRTAVLLLAAANGVVGLANYAHACWADSMHSPGGCLEQPELQLLT